MDNILNENCCYKNISMSFFPGTLWQKGAVLWELNSNKMLGGGGQQRLRTKNRTNMALKYFPSTISSSFATDRSTEFAKCTRRAFSCLFFLISEVQR